MSTSRLWRVALGLSWFLAAALPAGARAQLPRPRPKPARLTTGSRMSLLGRQALLGRPPRPRMTLAPAATGSETEPNDSFAVANAVALGDTISGNISPAGDVDWFTFDVPADTTIVLDVYASRGGSFLDPVLYLYPADTLALVAYSDDYNGLDSHIEYHARAGRYYAAITDYYGSGGDGYFYSLSFSLLTPPPLGPGDPTTVYATGLDGNYGVAAGSAGDIYVTEVESQQLVRVTSAGTVVPVASFPGVYPVRPVVDGFGNVLVTVLDTNFTFGTVERVTPAGAVSTFASGFSWVTGMTVGPDGDVWVLGGQNAVPMLFRLDPSGVRKDSIDISATGPVYYNADLAFSPTGVLHFSNGYDGIYALTGRTPQRVITAPPYFGSLAFDRDGYLYAAKGWGWVSLYDPSYTVVSDSFAWTNLAQGYVMALAFGRDDGGAMTSRLLMTNYLQSELVAANPAGVRAAGWRIGVDFLTITPTSLRSGTMGAPYADTLVVHAPPGTATWSVASGALPSGLALEPSTGALSGVFEVSGTFDFSVRVDAGGRFGVRAFALTVDRPAVSLGDAADDLLGGSPLDSTAIRFLDFQGNRNGRYDVGDFRAYLRAQGSLPVGPASPRKGRP